MTQPYLRPPISSHKVRAITSTASLNNLIFDTIRSSCNSSSAHSASEDPNKMKYTAFSFLAIVTAVSAFVPAQQNNRVSVEQGALADKIFGLDLFAPNPEVNTYGARNKKNVSAISEVVVM